MGLTMKQREGKCRNGHPGSDSKWERGQWVCYECRRSYNQQKVSLYNLRKDYDPYVPDPEAEAYLHADEFADRLRECRQAQGTQADVAMAAGVNAWTLQHRERNLKRNLRILSAYAASIGVQIDYRLKLPVDTDE